MDIDVESLREVCASVGRLRDVERVEQAIILRAAPNADEKGFKEMLSAWEPSAASNGSAGSDNIGGAAFKRDFGSGF